MSRIDDIFPGLFKILFRHRGLSPLSLIGPPCIVSLGVFSNSEPEINTVNNIGREYSTCSRIALVTLSSSIQILSKVYNTM